MKYPNTLIFVALASLCGCATPVKVVDYYDLPSSALANLRSMTVLPEHEKSDGDYTDLGVVSGFSCGRVRQDILISNGTDPMRKAIEQLKLNAAALGAEHVTKPVCIARDKVDFTNNCFASITCNSHALIEAAVVP